MKIAPSILDADFTNLQTEIDSLAKADRIHLDIMDGHYVPNMSFGASTLRKIDWGTQNTEVHLMVNNPENFFADFLALGVSGITFHIENTGQERALELLQDLRSCNVRAGICIDGYTSAGFLSGDILKAADQILVMSVKAGFGGQSFMPEALEKIKTLRTRGYKGEIEIDGGVNIENAPDIAAAGCDIAVVGSFLMKQKPARRLEVIKQFQAL